MNNRRGVWNDCSWPVPVRWIAFVPVGLAATVLVQGLIRFSNPGTAFFAECFARAAEPWAFLLPALWVLPRFNRAFIFLIIGLYLLFQGVYVGSIIIKPEYFEPQWAETIFALTSFISGGAAGWWALQQNYAVPQSVE